MIDLNYNRRFKEATNIEDTDYIYYDNGTQILQRISYTDFKTNTYNTILSGGFDNADEDVYKMLGGINGTSKNSIILKNE